MKYKIQLYLKYSPIIVTTRYFESGWLSTKHCGKWNLYLLYHPTPHFRKLNTISTSSCWLILINQRKLQGCNLFKKAVDKSMISPWKCHILEYLSNFTCEIKNTKFYVIGYVLLISKGTLTGVLYVCKGGDYGFCLQPHPQGLVGMVSRCLT